MLLWGGCVLECCFGVSGSSCGERLGVSLMVDSGIAASVGIWRWIRRHVVLLVLPKPLVSRVVGVNVAVSVIVGRVEGKKRSWAILEFAGRENVVLDVLERMTVMSPQ